MNSHDPSPPGTTLHSVPAQSRLGSDEHESALAPYLRAIRSHRVVVTVVIVAAFIASVGWVQFHGHNYEAIAKLNIAPLPETDTTFLGLGLLRDSGDPTRTVQTAASLVDTPSAAQLAASKMGRHWTAKRVLAAVTVIPEGQSNILDVTARADDPTLAARLANRFTQAALQVRSNQLRAEVTRAIANTRAQLASAPSAGPVAAALAATLTDLQAMATGRDPTITLAQPAIPPSSASGPGGLLLIVLGVLAGCAVAIGTALLLEIRNPSIRDEEEALTLYPLPVLARMPQLPLAQGRELPGFFGRPLRAKRSPLPLSMAATEAYRALRIQLELTTLGPRALMITSPSRSDGKTSTAVGLALELAASGVSVILVDGDLRAPRLRQVLRMNEADVPVPHAARVNGDSFEDLVEPVPAVERLKLLELHQVAAANDAVKLVTTRIGEVVQSALEMADYVIVDTAPLGEVSDPLSLIRAVDEVLVVVRLRNSRRTSLEVMRDRLERSNAGLVGYVIVGSEELPPYAYGDEPSVGMQSR